ncbi:MAG: hypothetical protein ACTHKJ_09020, partial [Candidatus Nitrosocosmicus sp.]
MADEFFSNSVDDSKENLVYNVNDNIDNHKTESLNSDGKRKIKAVALLSGGLDSNLAVRMVKDQGI